jgi:hypothetical protein
VSSGDCVCITLRSPSFKTEHKIPYNAASQLFTTDLIGSDEGGAIRRRVVHITRHLRRISTLGAVANSWIHLDVRSNDHFDSNLVNGAERRNGAGDSPARLPCNAKKTILKVR